MFTIILSVITTQLNTISRVKTLKHESKELGAGHYRMQTIK